MPDKSHLSTETYCQTESKVQESRILATEAGKGYTLLVGPVAAFIGSSGRSTELLSRGQLVAQTLSCYKPVQRWLFVS